MRLTREIADDAAADAANRHMRTAGRSHWNADDYNVARFGIQPIVASHMGGKRMAKTKERAVVVTTAHRGVFFGYATDTDGETIRLRAARLCLTWSADLRGFMGLASMGPSKHCRIGPAADITVRAITSVIECTPEAVARWEAAPWA